ncbi:MAG: Undecaprenyl pyrophosphate synthetase [Parcubacteria group bacterium GW2011_GWC1_42_11]|uniref:Isoprenyl transferase n=1 Tax=Candidatus Nomurabacteria bacterium GW2011_GWC2_42_20 TaxID=1618756 RepID=A0A0G0ZEQ0_9BACT|nr:MAG: Undecaprenyl pyrophosphate synthetase [Parcubacteria group bacterium GW2011_GWC1_42_11]KKS47210.1 MAG: Isoprenyl transferase [Candidatus Nomurabacteria bacterium GW2011_GWC2_42_20]KKT08298.1 MAG: Isoprenyl transferase [Candidatus Nomurabacteria bacterium GW2011_GWB1_43_20]TAN36541.1 MAG: di-trans,poly-cis-decaprenylcistransferase [Patescibacteria group bacterium]
MTDSQIKCVGIIMDGNRRWARAHNKPVFEGHNEGYKRLQDVVEWAREAGISDVVVFAFSTENWQRSEEEVGFLLKLLRFILNNEIKKMIENRVRVRFIGDRARFDDDIQGGMEKAESETAKDYDVTLHVAVSYGGRAEILSATNALLAEGVQSVTEDDFSKKLWSYPMPDPDLVIRTSGEHRTSGFLPWQTVYSELFFTDVFWPEFSKEEFTRIIEEFKVRERRHGK